MKSRYLYKGSKVKFYEVTGDSGNKYTVTWNRGKMSCDCPKFMRGGLIKMELYKVIFKGYCKHMLYVKDRYDLK